MCSSIGVCRSGHAAVFLGDLRFSELKRILNKAGIQAEFFGGILVCAGGLVNVRKVRERRMCCSDVLRSWQRLNINLLLVFCVVDFANADQYSRLAE